MIEIGLEEVPARMLAGAQVKLLKRTLALLTREQMVTADAVARSGWRISDLLWEIQ